MMERLRIIVLIVLIVPLVLNILSYMFFRNKRLMGIFFHDEMLGQPRWLPWSILVFGWLLVALFASMLFRD